MTTTPASAAESRQAAVDAALLILERMGLSPDDLAAAPTPPEPNQTSRRKTDSTTKRKDSPVSLTH